jgi:endonuclease/exonuclease/phosphatase family metal-dependent hydrolase
MFRWVFVLIAACAALQPACAARAAQVDAARLPCAARLGGPGTDSIEWVLGPSHDHSSLDRWCHGVGPAFVVNSPLSDASPALDELVVVTWNAHVGQGSLTAIVGAIRRGDFSGGRPAPHFVLLVQEAMRRGPEVPAVTRASAFAGAIGRGQAEDVRAAARQLDLSLVYVPSMRNGPARSEDRGNAILSTLPLHDPVAIELPFTRQRRVALGATVDIDHHGQPARLLVMNVHLDPLGSSRSLWLFGNPRQRQMAVVLESVDRLLQSGRGGEPLVATVLGGDLNALNGGIREAVYRDARRWATSLAGEDDRRTHLMGRLDYLFFRFPDDWYGDTTRGESRFGSDHYPVAGTFFQAAP